MYDRERRQVRRAEAGVAGTVSETILETVVERTGTEPTALPPLYDSVDPDSIDSLFASTAYAGRAGRAGYIEFPYAGHLVMVTFDDGPIVAVADLEAASDHDRSGST